MTTIDPATIRAALPKPGGREAVLLREVPDLAGPRIEVTLAEILPGGRGYRAQRAIGIGPAIRNSFVEAVGSLRTAKPPEAAVSAPPRCVTPASGPEIEGRS